MLFEQFRSFSVIAQIIMQQPEREDSDDETATASKPKPESYYYAVSGQAARGPCTVNELKVLWMGGYIGEATSLWREGMEA